MRIKCRDGVHPCDHIIIGVPDARGVISCPKCKGSFKVEPQDILPDVVTTLVPAGVAASAPSSTLERGPSSQRWVRDP